MIAKQVLTSQIAVRLAVLVVLLFASQAHASNFARCILDKMPGSANQAMNAAVWQSCGQSYPNRYTTIYQGGGRGLFGFEDGNACTLKKAVGTTFPPSANAIARACKCLYDPPLWEKVFGEPERCDDSRINHIPR